MILNALLNGEELTPLDALRRFGCFRLAARIFDLRKEGYVIEATGDDDFARYRMKSATAQGSLF